MLIRDQKAFTRGLLLLASFLVVLVIFFMPVFPGSDGQKVNGLEFSDHLFNTLSKGSANFFDPSLQRRDSVNHAAQRVQGKTIDLLLPIEKIGEPDLAERLLRSAGLEVESAEKGFQIKGGLYPVLEAVLKDSLSTFNNDLAAVSSAHGGADGRLVMRTWWQSMTAMIKPLQRAGQIDEASVVSTIISKGIEPSYNFYGITPLRVVDNIPLVAGLLIFYVIYTMWYGFAIFELFEGVGLAMKKSVRKEV